MGRPYLTELIDCYRDTLQKVEQGNDANATELQDLKRRVVRLLATLEFNEPENPKAA
jgi:hypothetical protein